MNEYIPTKEERKQGFAADPKGSFISMSCTTGKTSKKRETLPAMLFDKPRRANETELELKEALLEVARLKSLIKSASNGLADQIELARGKASKEGIADVKYDLDNLS